MRSLICQRTDNHFIAGNGSQRRYLLCWQITREKYAAVKWVHEPGYIAGIVAFPLGIGSLLTSYPMEYPMRSMRYEL